MTQDEQEQYSFGPWLVVVDSKELIPPQYTEYEDLILQAEFCIKVPVNKDRGDLRPGMLMYKELVLLNDTLITILTYNERKILKEDINISDIDYVIRGGELLNNYITFGSKLKEYTISYYSVSYTINSKIINYIRSHFTSSEPQVISNSLSEDFSGNDLYKFFQKSNHQDDVYLPIAYQKERYVNKYPNNGFGLLMNKFKQVKIDEVMFLVSGHELVIISGDIDKAKKSSVDYSYRHLYIRLNAVKRLRILRDDDNENLDLLEIGFEKSHLLTKVAEDFDYKCLKELVKRY